MEYCEGRQKGLLISVQHVEERLIALAIAFNAWNKRFWSVQSTDLK